jgi:hypothetical protein
MVQLRLMTDGVRSPSDAFRKARSGFRVRAYGCGRDSKALENCRDRALLVLRIFRSYLQQSRPRIGPRSLKTNIAPGH